MLQTILKMILSIVLELPDLKYDVLSERVGVEVVVLLAVLDVDNALHLNFSMMMLQWFSAYCLMCNL